MFDIKNKKIISSIINMSLFGLMLVGVFIAWQYKNGVVSKRETIFWMSVIVAIASFADFMFSIRFKESVSKGVIIKKEESPNLYMISIITTFILLLLAIMGIYYYW